MNKKVNPLSLPSKKNKVQVLQDQQLDRLKGGANPWLDGE